MKIIDISGFGHSGKGIISDLFREINFIKVPKSNFEFDLLRIQGGLIDLRYSLVENWSPIRSDAAIKNFYNLIKRVGPKATIRKPMTLFYSNGMNYDDYFNGKFTKLTELYLSNLIDYVQYSEWPYQSIEFHPFKQFIKRFLYNTGIKKTFPTNIFIAAPKKFDSLTSEYLDELLSSASGANNYNYYVTHNAVEPYNPTLALSLFNDAKAIIVQRDPRDIYVSAILPNVGYVPKYEISSHWKLKQTFLGTNNIEQFIARQKIYYDQVKYDFDNENVMRIKYEDVVLKYEESLEKIFHFLQINHTDHISKGKFFNPEISKKNIGLWKIYKNQIEIKKIESELSQYCYQ
jgi:hypothetical protein